MLFPSSLSRREFLHVAGAALLLPTGQSDLPAAETLFNGIRLPSPWPPNRAELPETPFLPPYLADPPAVINIDTGRQLFVDDFLIEQSSLYREFHRAVYHPASPVLTPTTAWEQEDPHARTTGVAPSPSAMPFSDGVFFDPADRLFKMWYMAGYQRYTALATSRDGIRWERPRFDVVAGTNIVFTQRRDSSTVWLDLDDPDARYKMSVYRLDGRSLQLYTSRDGIHWQDGWRPGPSGDRSTFFHNAFRDVWVFSLRAEDASGLHRYRRYVESRDFSGAKWRHAVLWTGADTHDGTRTDTGARPELYNLDAVPYESLLVGLFTMYRGEQAQREKPNDIVLGFSRDGFHWWRPWREPFITVSERQGDWNWANVQSAGGVCLVVGDDLYFYVSGRAGIPNTSLPGVCSTGLATLRRDGFASVTDAWPRNIARRVVLPPGTLTTRRVLFSGTRLFVNADAQDALRAEILDASGRVIEPFTVARCVAVRGNSTRHEVRWEGTQSLNAVANTPVRFRFTLSRTKLFSFWVSANEQGRSDGFVAAGGPAYNSHRDR